MPLKIITGKNGTDIKRIGDPLIAIKCLNSENTIGAERRTVTLASHAACAAQITSRGFIAPKRRTRMANPPFPALLILLFLSFTPLPVSRAQTNAPARSVHSHRYLLIIETSHPMQRRSDGVLQSAQDLLASKMGGQLRDGDTIGVWTYNEELTAGKLPVQQWSEDTQRAVDSRILNFIKEQKYQKQGKLEKVLPPLGHLIRNSGLITVFIISSGNEELHGTDFDDKINGVFKLWRKQQQEVRMPFVIALRGVKGNLTDCAVNPAPWAIELPALPPEPQVAKTKPSVPQKPAVTAPTLPPLIISGKKTDSAATLKNVETNPPLSAQTAPVSPNDVARQQGSLSVPASTPTIAAQPGPLSQLQAGPTPTAASTTPSPTVVSNGQQKPVADKPEMPQLNAELQNSSAGRDGSTGSAPPPAADLTAKKDNVPASALAGHSEASAMPTSDAPPAQAAVVTPRAAMSTSTTLFLITALFGIVFVLGLVWYWRSRPKTAPPDSLITQSLDRNRK